MVSQNYDTTEQEIIDALKKLGPLALREKYNETIDWTNAIKAIFSAIGHKEGHQTYFNYNKNANSRPFHKIQQDIKQMLGLDVPDPLDKEWLYDILWWRQNNSGYATDIPLVAEVEWGKPNDITYDFQKLLLARSKYRIMIFQHHADKLFKWFENQIQVLTLTQTGDRYLVCAWQGHQDGFKFQLCVGTQTLPS